MMKYIHFSVCHENHGTLMRSMIKQVIKQVIKQWVYFRERFVKRIDLVILRS